MRQILGWREYVRGIYWLYMPDYLERNALDASSPLPEFYWNAETDMNCLSQAIGQTLKYGYAHHIQRLMVTGLFSLLLGVDPKQVHRWYLPSTLMPSSGLNCRILWACRNLLMVAFWPANRPLPQASTSIG